MKTLLFLAAAVAVTFAFDFPEEWELWKKVMHTVFTCSLST